MSGVPATIAGLLVALVATACSAGESTSVDRTDPPIPTEPTRSPIDITVVPEEITVEYVQAVVDELDQAYSDTVRLAQSEGAVTEEVVARLEALYQPNALPVRFIVIEDALVTDFAAFHQPIGDQLTRVESLVSSSVDCLRIRASRDFSAMRSTAGVRTHWLYLQPAGPQPFNPTAWSLAYDGPTEDDLPPPGSCEDYA